MCACPCLHACIHFMTSGLTILAYHFLKNLLHQKGVKQYFIICHISFTVPICKAFLLIRLTYSVALSQVSLFLTLNKMTSKERKLVQRAAASTWEMPLHITTQIIKRPLKTNKPLLTLDAFVSDTWKDVQICQKGWPKGTLRSFKENFNMSF